MTSVPIYIKELKLKNVKSFGETSLNFELEDGTLPQWTIILGENGIGKSTLMQSIGWMRPFLPYKKDETPDDFVPAPIINDEENDRLANLVRKVPSTYNEGTYISALFQANRQLKTKKKSLSDSCITSMEIKLDNTGSLEIVEPDLKVNGESFYENEVLVYAYSASRPLGKGNLEGTELTDSIAAFINDKTELYDAQELMHTINYATLGSEEFEKEKYLNFYKRVKEMIVSLLPDVKKVTDIRVTTPKLINNKLTQGKFLISTRHGNEIPFEDFSLGYKTILSWSVDLAWRLFNKYSESPNPLDEPAIVLIDEIDLHLHPVWQIEIIKNLSKHFPQVQFIATAHSPLMVQAELKANYAILKYCEDHVEVINDPVGIDGWRVDQVLTSEFFGFDTARGPEYDKLFKRRRILMSKKELTESQREELVNITEKLSEFPTGNSYEEMADRMLIKEIIADYKASGKKVII